MYVNLETLQFNISEADIKAAYPLTSFNTPFIAPEGYAWYAPAPQPAHDPLTQSVREITPGLTDKGHWEQQWAIAPRYVEYTDEQGVVHTVAEQIASAKAAILQAKREAMVVNPWPIREALNTFGWRDAVEVAVAAGDQKTKDAWLHAKDFKRLDPLVLNLALVLNKTDVEMDELFELAMSL